MMASIVNLIRQSMPLDRFLLIVFCFTLSCFMTLKADNRFYISGIRVDVKDTSAAQARIKAITQGQRKAFKMLIEQLLSSEDQTSLVQPTENQLNAMIQDFEVQNEKNSKVRYIGTFAFQFYPTKVQEFLNQKEKTVLPMATNEKILVLPIYEENGKVLLWQEDNVWRNAWNQANDLKSFYLLPLGDLTDILDFPERMAFKKDFARLQILRERYHAGYILLTVLKHDAPFNLSLYIYDGESLNYLEEDFPLLGDLSLTPTLIQKALNKTLALIENFFAETKSGITLEKSSFEGRIMFQNHQEWLKNQKILSTVPGVRSFEVISLQRGQALIRLHHNGPEKRILKALEKKGFTVSWPSKTMDSKFTNSNIIELRFENSQNQEFTHRQNQESAAYLKYKSVPQSKNELKEFNKDFYETSEN